MTKPWALIKHTSRHNRSNGIVPQQQKELRRRMNQRKLHSPNTNRNTTAPSHACEMPCCLQFQCKQRSMASAQSTGRPYNPCQHTMRATLGKLVSQDPAAAALQDRMLAAKQTHMLCQCCCLKDVDASTQPPPPEPYHTLGPFFAPAHQRFGSMPPRRARAQRNRAA